MRERSFIMDNNQNQQKKFITLVILVSFIVSTLTGFIAGGISYELIKRSGNKEGLNLFSSVQQSQGSGESLKIINRDDAIVNVVKNASPAVVSIIVTKDLPIIERYMEEYDPFGDFFNSPFGNFFPFEFRTPQYRQNGTEKKEIGGGTGFVISSEGLIITNKHVVEDTEADYTVLMNDGKKYSAEVLAKDPVQDLALLKIDQKGLLTLKLGDSDNIQPGETVIAIGNALGEFRNTISVGVISGLKRSITASSGGQSETLEGVIQTDAAINPGNSGGPLISLSGEVIGVNVAIAQGAENIGFSIPINKAKRAIEGVIKNGKISYPYIGVRYTMINSVIKEKNNLSVDYGALILRGSGEGESAVISGSPADKAGIEENDIILEVDGQKVDSENSLAAIIQSKNIGDTVNLKILHKGEEKMVKLKLEGRD